MRHFIVNALRFSLFAVCFVAVGIIAWGQFVPLSYQQNIMYVVGSGGHLHSKLGELKDFRGVDIVVLGSSTALTGFDPRLFEQHGLSLFNLGSAMQTPIQTELLVERYIDELNPDLVLIETYPGVFGSDGTESALNLVANDHLGLDSIVMAWRVRNLSVYATMVYSAWRQMTGQDAGFVEEKEKFGTSYIAGGYVERPVHTLNDNPAYPEREWTLLRRQRTAFQRTLDKLHMRGIEVILVRAPIASAYYGSFTNNSYVDKYFQGTGLQYYNLNEEIPLTPAHFFDEVHLNQHGVEVMNLWVINFIKSVSNAITQ